MTIPLKEKIRRFSSAILAPALTRQGLVFCFMVKNAHLRKWGGFRPLVFVRLKKSKRAARLDH